LVLSGCRGRIPEVWQLHDWLAADHLPTVDEPRPCGALTAGREDWLTVETERGPVEVGGAGLLAGAGVSTGAGAALKGVTTVAGGVAEATTRAAATVL
jgi:hypothetical protein